MEVPTEPSKEDCCNSGCNPCIFDVYEKQMYLFKKYKETGSISELFLANAISQFCYTTFIVVDNVELCEAHKLLNFKLQLTGSNKQVKWKPGEHFILKYMDENYSCTRAYTPLKAKSKVDTDFSVIVKMYDSGVVSNYLYNLKPGQKTLWRGPYGKYSIESNKFNRILMIAQGTGIAPFISIIESILENEDDFTKLILCYCCRNVNSILLRSELYSMKSYWNFTYLIFLSDSTQNIVYKYQEPILNHKLSKGDILKFGPFNEKDQFLLCGSTHFMNDFKSWLEIQDVNIQTF